MKIAVIGNCQIESVAECLKILLPAAEIDLWHSWNLADMFATPAAMVERMRAFDVVLAHRFYDAKHIAFDEINRLANFIETPTLNFAAFHPDCAYLVDADTGHIVRTVTGDYNSSLVGYCFSRGFSAAQCQAAFCESVFAQVGYFSVWETALAALEGEFRRCGFDARAYVVDWLRRRPFMHSINHPRLFAVKDLVAEALKRKGVVPLEVADIADYASDPLLNYAKWPIYPEIASFFGERGEYLFKSVTRRDGSPFVFPLREFIDLSYQAYAAAGVKQFAGETMVAWDRIGLADVIRAV